MNSVLKTAVIISAAAIATVGAVLWGQEGATPGVLARSLFVSEIPLVKDEAASWLEFNVPHDMFDGGRWDLADLRLLDAADKELPYALRARLPRFTRQPFTASTFNRGTTAEGTAELSLDLGESPVEHNEVDVQTLGDGFRRRAVLEGSDNGETWSRLAETKLLRFTGTKKNFEESRIEYLASRHRYLRVRVEKDKEVDRDEVQIGSVVVRRTVEVPGEFVTHDARLGMREPGRNAGVTGSQWDIDLGGRQIPCQRLEVEINDDEFVRNYVLMHPEDHSADSLYDPYVPPPYYNPPYPADISRDETTPVGLADAFSHFGRAEGVWRRRAGESKDPLVIEMGNVRAGRLRLFVVDAANPPLEITRVRYMSAVCAVVLANSADASGPVRAYYGSPVSEFPNYDFARNLPARLDPPPAKLEPGSRANNASYIPPPLPFTERWRWLIHCTLGGVSLLLAVLVFQLARRVIARHDAQAARTPGPAPT